MHSCQKIGPALAANKASDPRLLSGLEQAIATASSTGGPSFKFEENGKQFQLSKKGDKWRFCFRSSVQKRPFKLDAVTYTDLNQKNFTHFYLNLCYSSGKPDIAILVTRDLNILCGLPTRCQFYGDKTSSRTKPIFRAPIGRRNFSFSRRGG